MLGEMSVERLGTPRRWLHEVLEWEASVCRAMPVYRPKNTAGPYSLPRRVGVPVSGLRNDPAPHRQTPEF
jgi:hypothetical protein